MRQIDFTKPHQSANAYGGSHGGHGGGGGHGRHRPGRGGGGGKPTMVTESYQIRASSLKQDERGG